MKPQLVKRATTTADAASEPAKRTPARDAIVDEYGPLAIEVQALSTRLRVLTAEGGRYAKLKDEIRCWFDAIDPAGKFLYESDRHLVEISAKENEAVPDMKGIYSTIGATRFLRRCSFTQKAAKEELTAIGKPRVFAKLFTWKRTGKRTVSALPKAAKEAA